MTAASLLQSLYLYIDIISLLYRFSVSVLVYLVLISYHHTPPVDNI